MESAFDAFIREYIVTHQNGIIIAVKAIAGTRFGSESNMPATAVASQSHDEKLPSERIRRPNGVVR